MKFVKSSLIALVLALTVFGLASAGYIGPNRTVTTTTWERQYCNYRATITSPAGRCYLTLYDAPGSCPSTSSVEGYFSPGPQDCGSSWPGTCGAGLSCTITLLTGSTQGCAPGETACTQTTSTTTYPPATVSGTTACTLPGNAGWCRGTATLNLSGNEPLAPGYSLTTFEGSPGTLCSAPSCAWTFPEGNTSLNYWVHSTFGDTSTMASASMMVDSVAPTLTLTISPANGLNGWFVSSPVTASASATDATSGVSGSASINADGPSFTASADGTYNLTASVSDVAGNTASASGTIGLDTTPPSLSVSIPPVDGSNDWYISPVTLTSSGSDVTSGLADMSYRLDGEAWTSGTSLSVPNGVHVVEFQASDVAGNQITESHTISVDTTPPTVTIALPTPQGAAGWYTSGLQFSATGNDENSGVQSVTYSLDGGATWEAGQPSLTEGRYTIITCVTDRAGNVTTSTNTVDVDPTPPQSDFTTPPENSTTVIHGSFTMNGQTLDLTSGPAAAEISMDGGTTWQPLTIAGGTWSYTWDTNAIPNGTYHILVRASDVAGNEEHTAQITLVVANQGPEVSITKTWWLWEQAKVSIHGSILPVAGAKIIISDGRGHARTYDFNGGNFPTTLKWDGLWDNRLYAPAGDFAVEVTAWDAFGNTGQDSGTVRVPAPLATPTAEPPAAPAPATAAPPPAAVVVVPTVVPQATAPTPMKSSPAEPAVKSSPPVNAPIYIWPTAGLVGLLAALASSSWSDKRPSALRRLAKALTAASGPEEIHK